MAISEFRSPGPIMATMAIAKSVAGNARRIVQRPQYRQVAVQMRNNLFLVPDVIARSQHIDSGLQKFFSSAQGQAQPARGILTVGDHYVNIKLFTQARQELLYCLPAGFAYYIADYQDLHI